MTEELLLEDIFIYEEILDREKYKFDYSRPIMERYKKKLVDSHYCELCVPVF